jgi:hypothetical protein
LGVVGDEADSSVGEEGRRKVRKWVTGKVHKDIHAAAVAATTAVSDL